MPKKVGKYEIGKTLGEGTFGKVKLALNTENQRQYAIKVLDKDKIQKQNMGLQIKKEISIMKMIKHPNVVELVEVSVMCAGCGCECGCGCGCNCRCRHFCCFYVWCILCGAGGPRGRGPRVGTGGVDAGGGGGGSAA